MFCSTAADIRKDQGDEKQEVRRPLWFPHATFLARLSNHPVTAPGRLNPDTLAERIHTGARLRQDRLLFVDLPSFVRFTSNHHHSGALRAVFVLEDGA